jgi:hypothetical protein
MAPVHLYQTAESKWTSRAYAFTAPTPPIKKQNKLDLITFDTFSPKPPTGGCGLIKNPLRI